MPRGDGTGPAGMGPMTGRAAGYCAGYPVPGFMNPVGGRGFWGFGRGGGRGWRRWYYGAGFPGWARAGYGYPAWGAPASGYAAPYPQVSTEQELTALKQQAEYFQDALNEINKHIEDLEKAKQEE